MPGFGGILSIARSALTTSQAAVQVASHNIANASTPGYSRQREVLVSREPERDALGIFGTGVLLSTVQRQRDSLLDQEYRRNSSQSGTFATRSELLQRVEGVFAEPSDIGLASTLDQFYNAWSDLAANPSNSSAKTVVQQRGSALASTFNSVSTQLGDLKAESIDRARAFVDDINRIAVQIAALNGQIQPAESGGDTASDLRDQRDLLLDQLGKIADVRVIDRIGGSNQVLLGSASLVDGSVAKQVVMNISSAARIGLSPLVTMSIKIVGSSDNLSHIGGEVGALQEVHNTDLTQVQDQLDALAASIIDDVNTLHITGWAGTAGNFFDATAGNTTAGRIQLTAAIAADAQKIAAGTLAATEPGDNSLALAMAALRDKATSAINGTFGADYRSIIGGIAGQLNSAQSSATVFGTMVDQADQRRNAVFGVSVDEELIQVMRQQQAYAAASKIIKTVDEMMQTLLSLK